MRRLQGISINLGKLIAGILFIIGWIKGEISGYYAWVLLFMFIDFEISFGEKKLWS